MTTVEQATSIQVTKAYQPADVPLIRTLPDDEIVTRWDWLFHVMKGEFSLGFQDDLSGNEALVGGHDGMINNGFLKTDNTDPTRQDKVEAFGRFRDAVVDRVKDLVASLMARSLPASKVVVVVRNRFGYIESVFGLPVNKKLIEAVAAAVFDDRTALLRTNERRREEIANRLEFYRSCMASKIEEGDAAAVRAATEIEKFEASLFGVRKGADDLSMLELVEMAQAGFTERKRAMAAPMKVIEAQLEPATEDNTDGE